MKLGTVIDRTPCGDDDAVAEAQRALRDGGS
jgi:hypothetical protein